MAIRNPVSLFCAVIACASGAWSPARAQVDAVAELESLAQASAEVGPGITRARAQINSGDLTGAVATLERVLIGHPEADNALLLHASLLCRLDDPAGARVEFAELRGRPIPDQAWAEATAACGMAPARSGSGG